MDKELILMNNLGKNPNASQRELSQITGLSLGSINILLSKMGKEGLIKLQKIPSDRMSYMLTPEGLKEKARKTRSYIQGHYQALENMRKRIKGLVETLPRLNSPLVIIVEQHELRVLLKQVLSEMKITFVEADTYGKYSGLHISDYEARCQQTNDTQWINIHEQINF